MTVFYGGYERGSLRDDLARCERELARMKQERDMTDKQRIGTPLQAITFATKIDSLRVKNFIWAWLQGGAADFMADTHDMSILTFAEFCAANPDPVEQPEFRPRPATTIEV